MRLSCDLPTLSLSGILASLLMSLLGNAESVDQAAEGQAAALGQQHPLPVSSNRHPDAQWFPQAGLGLFIHWGIASQRASGDLSWSMLANKPWKDDTVTPNEYYATIRDWKPDRIDFDSMLASARKAGFQYAVMVTKHHDGFTFWPTRHGDLGTHTAFGGRDFVAEFVAACRRHGLKVGLYYSPPDWWFDRAYKNFAMRGKPLDMDHKPGNRPQRPADHDARRADLVKGQVTELLSNYGKIDLIWFDGGKGEIPNADVRRLQPGIVINSRNGGGGDYGNTEGTLPGKRFQGWFETCSTCWPSRKWSYTEQVGFDDARTALTKLVLLRAWGGNLLANLGPKGDGSLPVQAVDCWKEMSAWMDRHAESVIGARPGPWPGPVNLPVTTRENFAYLHFLPEFPEIYPGTPAGIEKNAKTKAILPSLPAATTTAVWKDCPEPASATLMRTGESIPFTYHGGTLEVSLPNHRLGNLVEVVKVQWKAP